MFGACNYMVGSFVYGETRVYVWCMEFYGAWQIWSMEVNPGVCLVHVIIW